MSKFDPIVRVRKTEKVDFIVPERLREACIIREISYAEAAEVCGMGISEFGLMANGHREIPKEYIFNLMNGLNFPKGYFHIARWERV